jgi:metal-responsive CopG/Arc/MetJ family transcriptional regulator
MRTVISVDDRLLREADKKARLMGVSRSRLFALAVGDFLQRRRQEQMLRQLNEVYADGMESGHCICYSIGFERRPEV